jgi:hypothetical protein
MLRGIVKFRSGIVQGNEVTFPSFDFNPGERGVSKIEIEAPNGEEILSAAHLDLVSTSEEGEAIATKVHRSALDRICFFYGITIENGRMIHSEFSPVVPPAAGGTQITPPVAAVAVFGAQVKIRVALDPPGLKMKLEQVTPPGERGFPLFRSALQSASPVEEFIHLYHLLLMFLGDAQKNVDAFVLVEEPGVDVRPHPFWPGVNETLYTRLRNDLAHPDRGANVEHTKAEMTKHLDKLIAMTKRAIELHS